MNLLTMRIGAAHYDLTVGGHTFDLAPLNWREKRALRALVVEHLFPQAPEPKRRARTQGKPLSKKGSRKTQEKTARASK